jgi:hypothetical protein
MKNAISLDINTQFVPRRKDIYCLLRIPSSYRYVRFEVSTAVTMKNFVFWDIKTQFVLHRRHIRSLLHSLAG